MSHPHDAHRAHKVEKSRVSHITKGYAAGGGVGWGSDRNQMLERIGQGYQPPAPKPPAPKEKMSGGAVKHRADKRARGGKVKHKGATINILNAPGHQAGMPMPTPGAAAGPPPMPPRPPVAMPPPAGGAPGMMPPSGMPPGMPPRNHGGRTYAKGGAVNPPSGGDDNSPPMPRPNPRSWQALDRQRKEVVEGTPWDTEPTFGSYQKGGAVKSGRAWEEGIKDGTKPMNIPGKNDGKDIGRKRVITYKQGGSVKPRLVQFWVGGAVKPRAKGGRIESPKGVDSATKLPGGSGGARARLAKEHRAERDFHPKNRLES